MRNQKPTTNDYPLSYLLYDHIQQTMAAGLYVFFFQTRDCLLSKCRLTLYLLQLGRIFSPIGA